MPERLVDRSPLVSADALIAGLIPPPLFADASFAGFRPDPGHPSQAVALDQLTRFVVGLNRPVGRRWRRRADPEQRGVYLDGGFGVGKTHLLAALWHAAPEPKAYVTFVELTQLAGVLGFAHLVEVLADRRLLAVDEFELDDPGDTVLVSSLLSRLTERGVALAATSNTLPDRLGEDRFAAEDFRREIAGLAARFDTVRIDGPDYRLRGLPPASAPLSADVVRQRAEATAGATLDEFELLTKHLAGLHQSRYGALVDGVSAVHLVDVAPAADQDVALRLVVFADRLYDRQIPVVSAGVPLDQLFDAEMLAGGYRKKYRRALSRLIALDQLGRPAGG